MNHQTYPKGYRQVGVMDFTRDRKLLMLVNGLALAVVAVMLAAGLIAHPLSDARPFWRGHWWLWPLLAALYLAYIPLHELTHGVLMRLLSGVRPKYGFRLCYAYAGSTVYFDRHSHVLIALAPLILWGAVLFALEKCLSAEWFWLIYILQMTNISGSMGDVYCVLALLRQPKNILIQDTGTRMRILAPRPVSEEPK